MNYDICSLILHRELIVKDNTNIMPRFLCMKIALWISSFLSLILNGKSLQWINVEIILTHK